MTVARLLALFGCSILSLSASQLKFGLIYVSSFSSINPVPPGGGWGLSSFIVVNLGDTAFSVSDLTVTSSLISSTTSGTPIISLQNEFPQNLLLGPLEAVGTLDNGNSLTGSMGRNPELADVQVFFPEAKKFRIENNSMFLTFINLPDSGETIGEGENVVRSTVRLGTAELSFTTVFRMADPPLHPDTAFSIIDADRSITVPEPATVGCVILALTLWLVMIRPWHHPGEAVSEAILRAVRAAKTSAGVPGLADWRA